MPSVHSTDLWYVVVWDWWEDGTPSSYTLSVESDLPAPGIGVGVPLDASLDVAGEIDYVIFEGSGGSVVRLEVTAQSETLDLIAGIFDPRTGEFLAADDDSGPGFDPLIQGARLPSSGAYAIMVLSPFGSAFWTRMLAWISHHGKAVGRNPPEPRREASDQRRALTRPA